MVPAYILAAAFASLSLEGLVRRSTVTWRYNAARRRSRARRRAVEVVGAAARAAALVLGAIVIAFSIAVPVMLPVFSFPQPTGGYKVGTITYHWIDDNRLELFSTNPNEHREIAAQVWYPAVQTRADRRAPYIEDAGVVAPELARILHLPRFFFSYLKYVDTNALEHAPVARSRGRYPVLIYLTGLDGFRSANMFQVQALVSRGYIVVGLDQPGGAAAVRFPGEPTISVLPRAQIQPLIDQSIDPRSPAPHLRGRPMPEGVIPYFAQDVRLAIDRLITLDTSGSGSILSDRMDLHRIGVFGVSLGAMVAAEAALRDHRIRAVLMMDAAMPANVARAGLSQPAMWMTRPPSSMRLERSRSGGWSEKDIAQTLSSMQAAFSKHRRGSAYFLVMAGMFHVNFTDLPYWSPITEQLGLTGPVDGIRMLSVIDAYTLAFFDKYLKNLPTSLLDESAEQLPGVQLKVRWP